MKNLESQIKDTLSRTESNKPSKQLAHKATKVAIKLLYWEVQGFEKKMKAKSISSSSKSNEPRKQQKSTTYFVWQRSALKKMKTKSGIKICILLSSKSNEPTKVKLKLLCWATLRVASTAGAGNIARQEITFTTLSYFVYDVFKRTRSPDRRGSRRYLQLVKGVEKIVGYFFY